MGDNKKWKIFSLCFPPELAEKLNKECKEKTTNKSLFFRELLVKYFELKELNVKIEKNIEEIKETKLVIPNPLSNFKMEAEREQAVTGSSSEGRLP